MNDELLAGFTGIVGAAGVAGDVVSPGDLRALALVAGLCHQHGVPITVTSGPPAAPGGAPEHGGIILGVHRLAEIQVAAAGLTVRAGAGATVAQVRSAVAGAKLVVVGLGAETGSAHVGTLVARGEVPRRSLSGVEAVLSTGEAVKAGGAALKDVVGYDLIAALLGSAGRLAIIAAVTFRLEPAAGRTATSTPAGTRSWQPALAGAFDPKGLLRSGALR
ncbi:MAG: FAD-binding oxidoreductase [Candidatus Dormibacteria bacterium]